MKSSLKELWHLWKKSVNWDEKTIRQKLISLWFSLSFVVLGLCGNADWWFVALAIVNFGMSAYYAVKYVPVPEEDCV